MSFTQMLILFSLICAFINNRYLGFRTYKRKIKPSFEKQVVVKILYSTTTWRKLKCILNAKYCSLPTTSILKILIVTKKAMGKALCYEIFSSFEIWYKYKFFKTMDWMACYYLLTYLFIPIKRHSHIRCFRKWTLFSKVR